MQSKYQEQMRISNRLLIWGRAVGAVQAAEKLTELAEISSWASLRG